MNIDWHGKASVGGVSESTFVLLQSRPRSQPENALEATAPGHPAGKASAHPGERERLELLGDALATAQPAVPQGEQVAIKEKVLAGARSGLAKIYQGERPERFTLGEHIGLEAVILTSGERPSLAVRSGFVDLNAPDIGDWARALRDSRNKIRKVISSVGRIDIPVKPWFAGTCFVIAADLVLTNRHVLEEIAIENGGGDWTLKWPDAITVDFIGENDSAKSTKFKVTGVAFAGPDPINHSINFAHLDMAILRIDPTGDAATAFPKPVTFETDTAQPMAPRDVYLVGFPGQPRTWLFAGTPPAGYETAQVISTLFNNQLGVKRLAPGTIKAGPGAVPNDSKNWICAHDASTLGGNSGSCVADLSEDGFRILALHFAGANRAQNWAHVAARLHDQLSAFSATFISSRASRTQTGSRPRAAPASPNEVAPVPLDRPVPQDHRPSHPGSADPPQQHRINPVNFGGAQVATDSGAGGAGNSDLAELEAIKAEIEQLDLVPALNKLMDLLGRWQDIASRYLISHATDLLARSVDLEQARRSGKIAAGDFDRDRRDLIIEAERLVAMVKASHGAAAVADAAAEQASRGPMKPGLPLSLNRQPSINEKAVIDARGISKTYKATNFSLAPLDVTVLPREILGIVGVNGSGKSTLLDILRGEIAPDTGAVYYPQLTPDNQDWARIRPQIGYVPQRSVTWNGTVRAALEYACAVHRRYGSVNRERVDKLLARHGLMAYQNHTWNQLSSGYRLRFDLIMARIHNPRLMIFDEPLANLDPVSQQTFLTDLAQLSRGEEGVIPAIVLTSQHLYELEAIASNLVVLSGGRRVQIVKDRPCSYFEIWGNGLTLDSVQKAFFVLQPDKEASPRGGAAKSGWDVRMGRTACLVALDKEATIEKVVEAARAANLTLDYIRNVTNSARVDLDGLADEPPLQEAHQL